MKTNRILHNLIFALTILSFYGCKDELGITSNSASDIDTIRIGFAISTEEMEEMADAGVKTRSSESAPRLRFLKPNQDIQGIGLRRAELPLIPGHRVKAHLPEDSLVRTRLGITDIATNEDFHDSITIWGYTNSATTETFEDKTLRSVLFQKATLKKYNNWRSSVKWPLESGLGHDATLMRFYAFAPGLDKLEEGKFISNLEETSSSFTTPPTFTFTVQTDSAFQRDLLYAYTEEQLSKHWIKTTEGYQYTDNKLIDLNFHHALTCVRFAQGKIPRGMKIMEISLNNIPNQATFTSNGDTIGWTGLTGSQTFTTSPSWASSNYTESENVYISTRYFMIPQSFGNESNATLSVKLRMPDRDSNHQFKTDDETGTYIYNYGTEESPQYHDYTLTVPLKGDIWAMGHTVTYIITIGQILDDDSDDYLLLVDPERSYFFPDQNQGSFTVDSYQAYTDYSTNESGDHVPYATRHSDVQWTVKSYKLEDLKENMSEDSPSSGYKTYTYDLASNTYDPSDNGSHWISQLTGLGETVSGGFHQPGTFTLTPQTSTTLTQKHSTIFDNNNQITIHSSGVPIDLSLNYCGGDGTAHYKLMPFKNGITTANCYIVNHVGNYEIPLVYGNGMKGGVENTKVLNNSLYPAYDHRGHLITHAWITDQFEHYSGSIKTSTSDQNGYEYTVTTKDGGITYTDIYHFPGEGQQDDYLKVTWQDKPGLVNNLSIDYKDVTINGVTKKYPYLRFNVSTSAGVPGNAVVSLKVRRSRKEENGTTTTISENVYETAWSWHIWVTDEIYPNNVDSQPDVKDIQVTNIDNNKYMMMPVNLGWVPDDDSYTVYFPRRAKITLQQVGRPNTTASFYIYQVGYVNESVLATGTSTVYQWGRPTALPMVHKVDYTKPDDPTLEDEASPNTIYAGIGTTNFTFSIGSFSSVQDGLLHPDLMGRVNDSNWWRTDTNYKLWKSETDETENIPEKTLYDPCPVGYCVPPSTVFTGFSLTGNSTSSSSELNMKAGSQKKGAYFYADPGMAATGVTAKQLYGKRLVYIPATGYWSGNNNAGTNMLFQYKENSSGFYWTTGQSDKQGYIMQMKPRSSIEFKYANHDAMPIRPIRTSDYNEIY